MEFLRLMVNKLIISTAATVLLLVIVGLITFIVKLLKAILEFVKDREMSLVDRILGILFTIVLIMILITMTLMTVILLINVITVLFSNKLIF